MKKKLIYLLFILFFTINCFSQFSKTHYIPPLSNSDLVPIGNQYLYISTPSTTPVNFSLKEIGGNTINATVSRDTPFVYDTMSGTPNQLFIDQASVNSIFSNKGYVIEADDVVYVSVRVDSANTFQASEVVSKGLAALGTNFRIGGFLNTLVPATNYSDVHYTFVSILATENNTTVNFSNIKAGAVLTNNAAVGNTPPSITLNSGESFVIAVQGPTDANRDALIGALVNSNKPIVVNCGSAAGTNGELGNLDFGFDQIVSSERTGSDYIFVKNTGQDNVERVLLIANDDNTDVFLNGNTTASYSLNAGQYVALIGSDFDSNGNLYVRCADHLNNTLNKTVFAYQSVGKLNNVFNQTQANQELFFVPPLSCQTPKEINNIPLIEKLGSRTFSGRVTITTKTGSTLNFIINGAPYTLATLPSIGVSVVGPTLVTGNANYVCYTLTGLTGNISVFSTTELYLAAYGSDGAATFGGYYSGFTFKPQIIFQPLTIAQSSCIPNVELRVSSLSGFDTFQWYLNNNPIPGATSSTYTPSLPGNYFVSATLSICSLTIASDNIPVSSCPFDTDNDSIIDNIDLDNDNDGITNCEESFGNQNFNFFNTASGTLSINNYSNPYTGTTTFGGTGTPSVTPVFGDAGGNFITEAAQGKNNSVTYTLNFNTPLNLSVEYAPIAAASNLFTSSTEIRISCPVNKTLTIVNPTNQLLIDTNYDGIFESGITQFSSFEIRFRLNSSVTIPAGTGTFSIKGNLINSIIFTNINLSDTSTSKVALNLFATCILKDYDGDGVADQNDYDSDNDGILDAIEAAGSGALALTHVDVNADGIDDVFGSGLSPTDTDSDGFPNYLDLDSDNDGIHDLDESGFTMADANNNGVIDGANFGTNGLLNTLETAADSGIIKPIYILADTDSDGNYNYVELDSDNDLCNDVIEAGYLDSNLDGLLGGTAPPTVNPNNGLVTSGTGYGNPNANYITSAPIIINTQPQNNSVCELQNITFTISTNPVNTYQWQVSSDSGTTWTILTNNATYSGVATDALIVSNAAPAMNGYRYRCYLIKNGNTCGLNSAAVTLTVYSLPVVTTPISLKQCDDDTDGISIFNLTQKNDVISANYLTETFTYYTTSLAAANQNNTLLITNPIAYTSGTGTVYARVQNSNGCYRVAQINLIVSVTQIPPNYIIQNLYKCDDDRDGVAGITNAFDFTSIKNNLQAILPANVAIKFYKTQADLLAETDASGNSLAISNISNYRNIGFPNSQTIWVRVDSTVDNSCFGFKTFDVVVESLPTISSVNALNLIRHCDDDQNGFYGFDTSNIQSTVLNGQTGVNVKYFRANGTQLSTPLPNPFQVNQNETITIRVQNNTTQTGGQPCYVEETLQFIVDDLPEAFTIPTIKTSFCDNEPNPIDQDGYIDFDTSSFLNTIIGSQTGVNVYYYDQNNVLIPNSLPNQLPNPFRTKSQDVKVIVENPINTACTAQMIIPFRVNPTPKIDLKEDAIICLPSTSTMLNGGILDGSPTSNYQYQWYTNNVSMAGVTTPTLTVNSTGMYSVDVTNIFGCTKTRDITVSISETPNIQGIEVVDFADINTITINVTGSGHYFYALDDINGPYQESNFFNNVPMGVHDVYIRDDNGCGAVGPITVPVLGIPHYFTPNGDGFNDYWNVKGVSAQFNYRSIIYIFDRFGKLLKQIGTTGLGWDGTYNGKPMPADDYWYNILFEDGRSAKGHFTLKR